MSTNNNIQFSYYELSLLDFLRAYHPEKAIDFPFIKHRADLAAETYTKTFEEGENISTCMEMANHTLYAGLHFSKHDIIQTILRDEFSLVDSVEIQEKAIMLQPLMEVLFAKYHLSDEFGSSPEFELLYTEITGAIQLKLEEDGNL